MYDCPHCEKPGIPTTRKLFLGPARPATCKQCDQKVGVPWGHGVAAALPAMIPLSTGLYFGATDSVVLMSAAGVMITTVLQMTWVPLEARE